MSSAPPITSATPTDEGHSLPIPVWTLEESSPPPPLAKPVLRRPLPSEGLQVVVAPQNPPPLCDDGLQVVTTPVPDHAGLQVLSDDEEPSPPLPPRYQTRTRRCAVLPSRAGEWRVRSSSGGGDVVLCTLAVAVLVEAGVLDGGVVELILDERQSGTAEEEKAPRDPLAALGKSTFSAVSEVQRGESETALRSWRRMQERERRESDPGGGDGSGEEEGERRVVRKPGAGERLDRAVEVASSKKGVARIVGAGLAASGVYTRDMARGFSNVPRLYADQTAREGDRIVGLTSWLVAVKKGFRNGLDEGIAGFFEQPTKGAEKEGAKGFVKGFVKGVGGVISKPAAGGYGVAEHTFVGFQKSFEKSFSRRPTEEEYIVVDLVARGDKEMRGLTDQARTEILSSWHAAS